MIIASPSLDRGVPLSVPLATAMLNGVLLTMPAMIDDQR